MGEYMRKPLQAWRVERALTQKQLADACGMVQRATIGNIEAGRHMPSLATMQRVAEVLGVDARDVAEFADALDRMDDRRQRRGRGET